MFSDISTLADYDVNAMIIMTFRWLTIIGGSKYSRTFWTLGWKSFHSNLGNFIAVKKMYVRFPSRLISNAATSVISKRPNWVTNSRISRGENKEETSSQPFFNLALDP